MINPNRLSLFQYIDIFIHIFLYIFSIVGAIIIYSDQYKEIQDKPAYGELSMVLWLMVMIRFIIYSIAVMVGIFFYLCF